MLVPGTGLNSFDSAKRLCQQFQHCYYAVGLHPWFLEGDSVQQLPLLQRFIQHNKDESALVAIGETGLDFAIEVPQSVQLACFDFHLELAQQYHLPVIIHHRKSHNAIIQRLRRNPAVQGVIHAFSGSEFEAQTYVEMGFKLGVGGTITYERSQKTKRALRHVGIAHLLLETDAPSMPISGMQGKANSPEYLPVIARALAEVLDVDLNEVVQQTTHNFNRLFLSDFHDSHTQ